MIDRKKIRLLKLHGFKKTKKNFYENGDIVKRSVMVHKDLSLEFVGVVIDFFSYEELRDIIVREIRSYH